MLDHNFLKLEDVLKSDKVRHMFDLEEKLKGLLLVTYTHRDGEGYYAHEYIEAFLEVKPGLFLKVGDYIDCPINFNETLFLEDLEEAHQDNIDDDEYSTETIEQLKNEN